MAAASQSVENTALARVGLRLSEWFEKWFPDAFARGIVGYAMLHLVVHVPPALPQ